MHPEGLRFDPAWLHHFVSLDISSGAVLVSDQRQASVSGRFVDSAYKLEADGFGAICTSSIFRQILPHFRDYEKYLAGFKQSPSRQKAVKNILQKDGIVSAAVPTRDLAEIFCISQVSACCELLRGKNIPISELNREGMRLLVQQTTAPLKDEPAISAEIPPDQYNETQRGLLAAVNVIQNLDTIRVVQAIRQLGFLNTRSGLIHQLSLAVGNGYRDLVGLHAVPRILAEDSSSGGILKFDVLDRQAAHTVLINNDPIYTRHFSSLNNKQEERVLALNMDVGQAIDILISKQNESGLAKRNLVVGLRIDHRKIPNVGDFLRQVTAVIDQSADLFLTIGAGNSQSEFEDRLRCFDDLFNALSRAELKPLRILMHKQGSLEDQRSSPLFGNIEYTSYQILHCKLLRKKLGKIYHRV